MTSSSPQTFLPVHLTQLDANILGELLRSMVFDQSDGLYGCYSTFELQPGFQEGDETWRREFWKTVASVAVDRIVDSQRELLDTPDLISLRAQYERAMLDPELLDELAQMGAGGGRLAAGDLTINAAWSWDGDGTLAFMICRSNGEILRVIENTDCKKPHQWHDFGDEEIQYLLRRVYEMGYGLSEDDEDYYGPY